MVDARHATAKESTFGISDATLPRVVKIGCTHATPRFLTTGTAVCSRTSLARQQVDYKQAGSSHIITWIHPLRFREGERVRYRSVDQPRRP
jgi:hypothetical protein